MRARVMKRERLSIDVLPDERKKIKVYAAIEGKTIKEFILGIIHEWMQNHNEKNAINLMTTTIGPVFEELWDNDEDSSYDKM